MIRGPVLPQSRESLWALVSNRLDVIERGLSLVAENFDCSGHFGSIEALARDAVGSPVLVILATADDPGNAARTLDAIDFLERAGAGLSTAIPEAQFDPNASARVVVIAVHGAIAALTPLLRREMPRLQVCRLEAFRLAGSERFAVLWQSGRPEHGSPVGSSFACPSTLEPTWRALHDVCLRIDPAVSIDGDRYRRQIRWRGRLLGEVVVKDGALHTTSADGQAGVLAATSDLRQFSDRLLRSFVQVAGLTLSRAEDASATRAPNIDAVPRHASDRSGNARLPGDSLRSVAATSRVSPEEFSALGGSTSAVDGETERVAVPGDIAKIVAAPEGPWASRRAD